MINILLSTINLGSGKESMFLTQSKTFQIDTLFAIKHPILYSVVLTITITVLGVMPRLMAFDVAFRTGVWATAMTLLAAILLQMGMLLCSVALILFSISKLVRQN